MSQIHECCILVIFLQVYTIFQQKVVMEKHFLHNNFQLLITSTYFKIGVPCFNANKVQAHYIMSDLAGIKMTEYHYQPVSRSHTQIVLLPSFRIKLWNQTFTQSTFSLFSILQSSPRPGMCSTYMKLKFLALEHKNMAGQNLFELMQFAKL